MSRNGGSAARRLDHDDEEEPTSPGAGEQLTLGPDFENPAWVRREHAFADALVLALLSHEPGVIRALLAMPAAGSLPREVREEAEAFTSLSRSSMRAPMRTLLYRRRLEKLMVPNV